MEELHVYTYLIYETSLFELVRKEGSYESIKTISTCFAFNENFPVFYYFNN